MDQQRQPFAESESYLTDIQTEAAKLPNTVSPWIVAGIQQAARLLAVLIEAARREML